MADKSAIEWTDATWNPVLGCSIVSPGCTNCYAMKEAYRFGFNPNLQRYHGLTKKVNDRPVWTGKIAKAPNTTWLAPIERKKPTKYFVNSMGDLFHEDCPDDWILDALTVMAIANQHTFQIVTKRADRMWEFMSRPRLLEEIYLNWYTFSDGAREVHGWPLSNVWLGVSTERQQEADERIPLLLETPAAVRFISAEPLLGPLNLFDFIGPWGPTPQSLQAPPALDWVIVGGESGQKARPMHPDWARSLRDQCGAAGIPFFFKQWGEWAPSTEEQAAGNPRSGWQTKRAHPCVAKAEELYPQAGAAFVERLGKKAAGRLLDGVEHNAMPEVTR